VRFEGYAVRVIIEEYYPATTLLKQALAIKGILTSFTVESTDISITVQNAAGNVFVVTLASDPDVRIQEHIDGKRKNVLVIEIKGGSDRSNQHNRISEAEKSHRKAWGEGYREFWTIIRTTALDMEKAKIESPTTRRWFDTAQVGARSGADWVEFRRGLCLIVGISGDDTR
jgi:hypothetical protein